MDELCVLHETKGTHNPRARHYVAHNVSCTMLLLLRLLFVQLFVGGRRVLIIISMEYLDVVRDIVRPGIERIFRR